MYWWQAVQENDPRVVLYADEFKYSRDPDNFSNLHVDCSEISTDLKSAHQREEQKKEPTHVIHREEFRN